MVLDHKTKYFECKLAFTNLLRATMKGKISQTLIVFAIVFIIAMLGMIPIFLPLLSVLVPIFGGIPFMLFLTKVRKFGMIWIMNIIMRILMFLKGMCRLPDGKLMKKHFEKVDII